MAIFREPQLRGLRRNRDYRLNFGSPGIDSGNALVAPATDMMGDPLYNDPRTKIYTGVPNSAGDLRRHGVATISSSRPRRTST